MRSDRHLLIAFDVCVEQHYVVDILRNDCGFVNKVWPVEGPQ